MSNFDFVPGLRPQSAPSVHGKELWDTSTGSEAAYKPESSHNRQKPMSSNFEFFQSLLSKADIQLNGERPWDIQIKDEAVFDRVLADGSLGFGESYMDGLWECQQMDELFNRILRAKIDQQITLKDKLKLGAKKLGSFLNPQSLVRVKKDVPFHYDLGNDLFFAMLDKRMTYTCAYWEDANTLDEAQEAKLDLVCRKLDLKPGMRILDIGCGWGSFMKFAAEKYGVICDGLTLSKEQTALGREMVEDLPVQFILQDYREFTPEQPYDRIVSIGMFEHVGPSNYDDFFACAKRAMKQDGIFLLHTIGGEESHPDDGGDPWIHKYIFPNGVIPSLPQITTAMMGDFVLEDLQNIGPNYDTTLMAWHQNFEKHWDELSEKYGEKFYRMWRYYLLSCAGGFRSRDLNVWQLSLTMPNGIQPAGRRAA